MKERIPSRKPGRDNTWALTLLLAALALWGCIDATATGGALTNVAGATAAETTDSGEAFTAAIPTAEATVGDSDDLEAALARLGDGRATIDLGESVIVTGTGAVASGTTVTITSGGVYRLSGVLADGQIVVDAQDGTTVELILEGASVTCTTGAPIYVRSADATVIYLAEATENSVSDGATYTVSELDSDEPNVAVFSKGDLWFAGSGSLTVTANYNDGITSKDNLTIAGGDIRVVAASDGIRGRDSIVVSGGHVNVTAGEDGLQSNNDEDPARGYVLIEGGSLEIVAGADGIQGETSARVAGGSVSVTSGTDASFDSGKGIKAGVDVAISGGTLLLASTDDAIHSNGTMTIEGGVITISSADDAIHAETSLVVAGGEIEIERCYEGLESAAIAISGGSIAISASDDGVNVSSGSGTGRFGWPGDDGIATQTGNYLRIDGGRIVIEADGDGIDVNGSVTMTDGVLIVNGPTSSANGALDYNGGFPISGGILVAAGSAGMAQAPDTTSTQCSVMLSFAETQAAGTMVHVQSADGDDLLTFMPTKPFQSLVFSSASLKLGSTYVVYLGGNSTGDSVDGLYSGGAYSGGVESSRFTVTGVVTGSGFEQGGGFGPGQGRGRGGRQPRGA